MATWSLLPPLLPGLLFRLSHGVHQRESHGPTRYGFLERPAAGFMVARMIHQKKFGKQRVRPGLLSTLNELLPGNDGGCSTSLYLDLIGHPGYHVNLPELGF